eukprot:Rhum_TRINITY_DN15507_c3_g1::Rhum_TRINITY_DN15507_c3_g1_i2::g.161510::m.161510
MVASVDAGSVPLFSQLAHALVRTSSDLQRRVQRAVSQAQAQRAVVRRRHHPHVRLARLHADRAAGHDLQPERIVVVLLLVVQVPRQARRVHKRSHPQRVREHLRVEAVRHQRLAAVVRNVRALLLAPHELLQAGHARLLRRLVLRERACVVHEHRKLLDRPHRQDLEHSRVRRRVVPLQPHHVVRRLQLVRHPVERRHRHLPVRRLLRNRVPLAHERLLAAPLQQLQQVHDVHRRHVRHHTAARVVQLVVVDGAHAPARQLLVDHAVRPLPTAPRRNLRLRRLGPQHDVRDVALAVVVHAVHVHAVVRLPLPPPRVLLPPRRPPVVQRSDQRVRQPIRHRRLQHRPLHRVHVAQRLRQPAVRRLRRLRRVLQERGVEVAHTLRQVVPVREEVSQRHRQRHRRLRGHRPTQLHRSVHPERLHVRRRRLLSEERPHVSHARPRERRREVVPGHTQRVVAVHRRLSRLVQRQAPARRVHGPRARRARRRPSLERVLRRVRRQHARPSRLLELPALALRLAVARPRARCRVLRSGR